MLIHAIIPASRANGPGLRAVVFVQGCSLACVNCFNVLTHAFVGEDWPVDRVMAKLLDCHREHRLDGITFSGGEPMQQACELAVLMERLRGALPDVSIGMFTGYSRQELEAGEYAIRGGGDPATARSLWATIQAHLDFAVMGRYNHQQPCPDPMRSSRNQTLELFSSRHSAADFQEQTVEITISATGLTTITGFPTLGVPA